MKSITPVAAAALAAVLASPFCFESTSSFLALAFQSAPSVRHHSSPSRETTSAANSNDHASPLLSSSSTILWAKNKKNSGSGGGKGFGSSSNSGSGKKEPKYSIQDKSYGITSSPSSTFSNNNNNNNNNLPEQTFEEAQASMSEFFTAYSDWKPLFRNVMNNNNSNNNNSPMASSFLSDTLLTNNELWGIPTLEQRNPWRLLPSKPTAQSSLQTLSKFLDEWQQSLLDIPLDSIVTGENDLHFLEEGRRTIAVTRFHVLEEYYSQNSSSGGGESVIMEGDGGNDDWEAELFRTAWSEMAHLMSQDVEDTGSLVLLPDHLLQLGGDDNAEEGQGVGGLEYVKEFVQHNLLRPIQWLGREDDWEIVAMERGSLAVRLLYKLSDIPDLSERDQSGDEDVKF